MERLCARKPPGWTVIVLMSVVACGKDDPNETGNGSSIDSADSSVNCAGAPTVTWENWGEGFFITWCQACHSAISENRNGAPEGIDFDTADDVRLWTTSIQRTVLEDGTMPMGGGLSEDDRMLLTYLIECGL